MTRLARRRRFMPLLVAMCSSMFAHERVGAQKPVVVASKPFGESYLLAELFAQVMESRGIAVERRPGLGATEIALGALRSGDIDVYPEYAGTGLVAVLHAELPDSLRGSTTAAFDVVSREFARRWSLRWLPPLGFQNTYAIAVTHETARRLHLRTLSDLGAASPKLVAGFTADFVGRADGLPGLARTYGVHPRAVRAIAPAVKYQALAAGAVDVVDGYSTDGLLARYDLVTLVDDRHFFPPYEAAPLVGARLARERPDAIAALTLLAGRLSETHMRALNQRVEVAHESVARVAHDALVSLELSGASPALASPNARERNAESFPAYLAAHRGELAGHVVRHLQLTAFALALAILFAVPLGLSLERAPSFAGAVLGTLGVVQTVPSIALLAFMLPLLGVGFVPALVALWLYTLYPIARATYTGVRHADPSAVAAAESLGASPRQRLFWVRLPLAAPVIMGGIRSAAVLAVGAATLAAFIGAGGLGEPIVTGLSLDDPRMVLSGAVPAALLALALDGVLALVERAVAPAHLRRGYFGRGSLTV